ncbi:hypothetical protein Tco_0304891 [Tanacetum coccineum]
MYMKETSLMLTMLILGPRSPVKDIDVYLQPLIKELQELWKGVWTKDTTTGTHFQMKVAVLWTINDFPARKRQIQRHAKGKARLGNFESSKGVVQKVIADDNNITGMKSHDCHIMMHRLLPYGVQRYLPKNIAAPIIELCLFFKQLCARTLMQQDMAKAKKQSISIMIELEKIFPPAFFDIMIHVAIHLPDEAILGGPLRYRWMFPFERYMKKLKNYVRNKAKPEGSIAEGYVAEEALTFCSRYLKDVETRFNHPGRNDDDVMQAVVWFVLNNSPEVDADILAYREESPDNVETSFPAWFNYKHTDLSINAQSTEVDAPPVNDDNANANEDNADFINNEDDVVAHVLDDDDVEVSDDDEVNPSNNVEEVLSSDDCDDDN